MTLLQLYLHSFWGGLISKLPQRTMRKQLISFTSMLFLVLLCRKLKGELVHGDSYNACVRVVDFFTLIVQQRDREYSVCGLIEPSSNKIMFCHYFIHCFYVQFQASEMCRSKIFRKRKKEINLDVFTQFVMGVRQRCSLCCRRRGLNRRRRRR